MAIVRDEAADLSRAISRTPKAQQPRAIQQGHRDTPRQDAPSKPGITVQLNMETGVHND